MLRKGAEQIEFLLEQFGPERCMCGSDFPLLLETDRYRDYNALFFNDTLASVAARDMVLGKTAMKFWRFGSEYTHTHARTD